jgi:hypothetical protein
VPSFNLTGTSAIGVTAFSSGGGISECFSAALENFLLQFFLANPAVVTKCRA